jgi:hypothetical protein
MKKILAMAVALAVLLGPAGVAVAKTAAKTHGSSAHSTPGSHGESSSTDPKIHVRGYTRKDGTYVAPHDRARSGRESHSYTPKSLEGTPGASPHVGGGRMGLTTTPHVGHPYSAPGVQRDEHGKIKRSEAVKGAFKHSHPCPTTGKTIGPCPGYVIDHIVPLCASGPDAVYNMQWQTTEQSKEKDRWERKECTAFRRR